METVVWKPDQPEPPAQPPSTGPRKYVGEIASGYNAKREDSPKWQAEQRIVENMLADMHKGMWVLDCPVGTGRFLPFYEQKGLLVNALDLSKDMLGEARALAGPNVRKLHLGDVRATGLKDKSVDASVMVRLTRWLSPEDCVVALKELQRVTRRRIVFTARVRNHPHARPYELILSALDGWHIARDEAAGDDDYRVIALEPGDGLFEEQAAGAE